MKNAMTIHAGEVMRVGGGGSMSSMNQSIRGNLNLRRGTLDKYFRKDKVVLFDPKRRNVKPMTEAERALYDARMQHAAGKRTKKEWLIRGLWAALTAIVIYILTFVL